MLFLERPDDDRFGFTYVQGMNVLAAPFLYTMPSEIEAFFCFAKFIEEACPLYVQPTLEGVHRGLKVSPLKVTKNFIAQIISYWIDVWNMWILASMFTCVRRICQPKFMPFLVSSHLESGTLKNQSFLQLF